MRKWLAVITSGLQLAVGTGCALQHPGSPQQAVANFVRPVYVHGVPYDDARNLGSQAVDGLERLLADEDMAEHRSNIVTVLGMLGSEKAEKILIAFVQTGSGPLPGREVSLRLDALTALGYAANVATSDTTLRYLIDGLRAENWESRLSWRLESGADPFPRLRQRSVAALGLSGKKEALTVLQALLAPGANPPGGGGGRAGGGGGQVGGGNPPVLPPSEQAVLAGAIKTNTFVAAQGLSAYYKTFRNNK